MSYYNKSQNTEDNSLIWPGFVDVLASTLMVIIFVVLLFTVAQVYLGDLVVGKNEEIQNLESKNIKVEYLEHRTNTTLNPAIHDISDTSIFIACFIDNVRLIDNIQI